MPQCYCYTCNRNVQIDPNITDFTCPICHGGFIEMLPESQSQPQPQAAQNQANAPFARAFVTINGQPRDIADLQGLFGGQRDPSASGNSGNDILSGFHQLGARVRQEIDRRAANNEGNSSGESSQPRAAAGGEANPQPEGQPRVPLDLGAWLGQLFDGAVRNSAENVDVPVAVEVNIAGNEPRYAFGRNGSVEINIAEFLPSGNAMQDIFQNFQMFERTSQQRQQLSEQELTRILPFGKVLQKHVDNGAQCTTCFDTFSLDEKVVVLDCDHIFHQACIVPWFKEHTSCPVCRQAVNFKSWKEKYENKTRNETLDDLD